MPRSTTTFLVLGLSLGGQRGAERGRPAVGQRLSQVQLAASRWGVGYGGGTMSLLS